MSQMEKKLFQEAVKRYKRIYPVSRKRNFKDCFTYYEGMLIFWFNTIDRSTHVVKERV